MPRRTAAPVTSQRLSPEILKAVPDAGVAWKEGRLEIVRQTDDGLITEVVIHSTPVGRKR